MMQSTPHTATPDDVPMVIWHERPLTTHDLGVPTRLFIRRAECTGGALSAAGLVAVVEAVSAYLSGLSPAARDGIADRPPYGLTLSVARTEVAVSVAPGDADDLAASLADVLTVDGNVITDPSS